MLFNKIKHAQCNHNSLKLYRMKRNLKEKRDGRSSFINSFIKIIEIDEMIEM